MHKDDVLVLFGPGDVEAPEYFTLRDYLLTRLLVAGFREDQIASISKIEFERMAVDETDEDRITFDFLGGWAHTSTFYGSWDHQAQHASLSYSRDGSIVDHPSPLTLTIEEKMAQFLPDKLDLYPEMSVTIHNSHEA